MTHLAIINKQTGLVENIAVPPQGANIYFIGDGFEAVETDVGQIGDTYKDGEFLPPVVEQPEAPAEESPIVE